MDTNITRERKHLNSPEHVQLLSQDITIASAFEKKSTSQEVVSYYSKSYREYLKFLITAI